MNFLFILQGQMQELIENFINRISFEYFNHFNTREIDIRQGSLDVTLPFSGKEFKHKLKSSNFLKGPNMFEIYLGIYDGFIYIPAILIKKSLTGIFLYF